MRRSLKRQIPQRRRRQKYGEYLKTERKIFPTSLYRRSRNGCEGEKKVFIPENATIDAVFWGRLVSAAKTREIWEPNAKSRGERRAKIVNNSHQPSLENAVNSERKLSLWLLWLIAQRFEKFREEKFDVTWKGDNIL